MEYSSINYGFSGLTLEDLVSKLSSVYKEIEIDFNVDDTSEPLYMWDMGRLDRWVFSEHSRQARRRGDDWQVRKESGTRISTTTFGFSARAVMNTPPLKAGIFIKIDSILFFKWNIIELCIYNT